jgi:hypothetical protein
MYRGFGFVFLEPGCDKWYQSYIDRMTQTYIEMVDFQSQINLLLLSSTSLTSISFCHCLANKEKDFYNLAPTISCKWVSPRSTSFKPTVNLG